MRTNILILIVSIIVVFALATVMLGYHSDDSSGSPAPSDGGSQSVEIQSKYDTKIVYTTDMGKDKAPFANDCRSRGGIFEECGSVCEPEAEICTEQCAYVCDLDETDDIQ